MVTYRQLNPDDIEKINSRWEQPVFDPVTGAHYWMAIASFHVTDPCGQSILDVENLTSLTLGCFFCERDYEQQLQFQRCPGRVL